MPEEPINPPPTSFVEWCDTRRESNRRETLAASPDPDALWVFCAGSLIWDPRFEPDETRAATLTAYRRAFTFWTIRARGSFERPGLGLALEPGGTCAGVAFRVPVRGRDEILDALWRREMSGGVYVPTWVEAETDAGSIRALGFVANRDHRNYTGKLPRDLSARIIATAQGSRGPCHEYLSLLIEALDHHDLPDAEMRALHNAVQRELGAVA
ncbi:MAG: gamma-glutamylcyclotransferase [Rhodospirillaceae bacterium]|nr:gamma-glutamylcyclotransferase [Rhodospirillaceae bacterium]